MKWVEGNGYAYKKKFKALTALVGQLSLSVSWKNGPERGLKMFSFNPSVV